MEAAAEIRGLREAGEAAIWCYERPACPGQAKTGFTYKYCPTPPRVTG